MAFLKNIVTGLRALFRKAQVEREMDEELRGYLDAAAKDKIQNGMTPEEARRAARQEMGSVEAVKDDIRSAGWESALETLGQDIRYGMRQLRRSPGFATVAVLSLALGIGANSTVFSIVDSLFLRPWPVKDAEHLVGILSETRRQSVFETIYTSYPDYLDIRHEVGALSDVVASGLRGGFISGQGQGAEVSVEVVSQNYFAALGVHALRGRTFSPQPEQEVAEGHSVVVSYALWRRYFGGDPALPGKTTLLDGKEFTVIGVAPRNFCGLRSGWAPDIWVTTEGWDVMVPGERRTYSDRGNRWFELAGYRRGGVQLEEVRAQLETLAQRIALSSPDTNRDISFRAAPDTVADRDGLTLGIYLMAMVGLVLLISCANVAVLTLAQNESRQREIAMRRALGAGRLRLVRQLLTEGLLLSSMGGVLGVLLAWRLTDLLPKLVPQLAMANLQLDHRVLLFTAAISLLTATVFALAPGLRAANCDLIAVLKGETSRWGQAMTRLPLRSLLVSGEIALSVILLTGSALLVRSLIYSRGINPGFDTSKNVLMLSVAPPMLYGYNEAQSAAIYRDLAARVETVPGVISASYARRPPLTEAEGGELESVVIPGLQPPPGSDHFSIRFNIVAPKFFATIGARLLEGRDFAASDLPSQPPVVIVNDAMARRFWPNQDAVGRSIQIDKKDYRIVGVVESGRYVRLHEAVQPYLFMPFTQVFSFECVLFVETAGDPQSVVQTILKETGAVDKRLPIVRAVTFSDYMRQVLSEESFMASSLMSLGVLGMFLAAVGLYAAVAYVVNRRTREIGIRMALGASRNDVLRHVLAQGLRLSAVGAAVGLTGAFAASRLMSRFIYGVGPADPASYAAGTLVAIGVSLLACYLPARRATKVDPVVALQYE